MLLFKVVGTTYVNSFIDLWKLFKIQFTMKLNIIFRFSFIKPLINLENIKIKVASSP